MTETTMIRGRARRAGLLRFALSAFALLGVSTAAPAAINPDDLLPVDEAFALTAQAAPTADGISIHWKIADGYYL
ncbi:MAG: hypothetical protein HOQ33_23065, partial [Cupriavidus sp.]|nr:hypothetical protein [Cupriavidus sp.]